MPEIRATFNTYEPSAKAPVCPVQLEKNPVSTNWAQVRSNQDQRRFPFFGLGLTQKPLTPGGLKREKMLSGNMNQSPL